MNRALLLCALALSGCDRIDDYFSNVVAEGLFLGADDAALQQELGAAAAGTAFVARASSLQSIEANLVDDADDVAIVRGSVALTLENEGSGTYLGVDDGTLTYLPGSTYTLRVRDGGRTFTAALVAPDAPDLGDVPDALDGETHPAGQGITVDLTGQGFDNHITLVLDASGNVTWDSRPQAVGEYLDWIGSNEVTTVAIPGSAFPDAGAAYVLGVAGIRKAVDADFDEFNPLLSNFAAGTLEAVSIATAP